MSVTAIKQKLNKLDTSFEKITPEIAAKMLEKNTHNRTLSQALVDSYAAEMRRGAWDEDNGETIKVAVDDTVVDGQHRLWAIVESGVTLRLLVVRGVALESFKTIDTGKKRTPGDVCSVAGIKNANMVAAAAVVALAYKKKRINPEATIRGRDMLRSDIVQFCLDNSDDLYRSTAAAMGHGCGRLAGSGMLIGMHYLFCQYSKAERASDLADEFFKQLGTGLFDTSVATESHPVRTLREKLLANRASVAKLNSGTLAAMFVKTWNAYASKRSLQVLRMAKGDSFPVVA